MNRDSLVQEVAFQMRFKPFHGFLKRNQIAGVKKGKQIREARLIINGLVRKVRFQRDGPEAFLGIMQEAGNFVLRACSPEKGGGIIVFFHKRLRFCPGPNMIDQRMGNFEYVFHLGSPLWNTTVYLSLII